MYCATFRSKFLIHPHCQIKKFGFHPSENVDFPLFRESRGNPKDFSGNCSLKFPGIFGTGKSRETSLINTD